MISVKKSAFSSNAQSRFASVVVDGVLVPPRLARHTLQFPCISAVPEAMHEASLKGPRQKLGRCWEDSRESTYYKYFPDENSLMISPPLKSMIFYKKKTEKKISW